MNFIRTVLFTGLILLCFQSFGQRRMWDGDYNRLGLQAGANRFNIITDDLGIAPKVSWTAGFTTRASFYNDFQFVYGINFFDFNVDIDGREKIATPTAEELIPHNMIGVQLNFFGSYKLYDHYLSIEAGPVVQVNSKLEPRQDRELWYISNYDVQAIDIEKVSSFNALFAIGLTGGLESAKLWVQYQHGLNNIFGGLNDGELQKLDPDFPKMNGRMSIIVAGLTMYL
jgi:hypothetical protein